MGEPVNEPDAQSHPSFSYRPETGEEPFTSLLAVPIKRRGDVLGVLITQNKTRREYSAEDVEVLETTAMVLAEHFVSGDVAGVNTAAEFSRAVSHVVKGASIAEGIALGHVVMHESRVVVTHSRARTVTLRQSDSKQPSRSCAQRSTNCSTKAILRAPANIATCSTPIACSRMIAAG